MKCKTKLTVLAMFLLSSFIILSCNKNDELPLTSEEQIDFTDLPELAQLLLESGVDVNNIDLITKSSSGYDVSYKAYKIDFDKKGEWKKIKAKNNMPLPEDILYMIPTTILDYIDKRFPGRGIYEIERDKDGYEVELFGKPEVELEFDSLGLIIDEDIDDDEGNTDGDYDNNNHNNNNTGNYGPMNFASLPQASQDFINAYFKGTAIRYIKRAGNEYHVGLVDDTRLEFFLSGEIQSIVAIRRGSIPSGAIMPTIQQYVKSNYPNRQIVMYINQSREYMIELSGYPVTKIFFDMKGNFLRKYPRYM